MSLICDVCGKRPSVGNNVSHANNKTKRRWLPNLQPVKALVDGRPRRMRACTACIRSNRVVKVPRNLSGQRKVA